MADEDNEKMNYEEEYIPSTEIPRPGLSVLTCALFIVGEMAGSGVLALPKALENGGWSAVVLLVVCCFVSLYCGIMLSRCWTILRNKKEIYQSYSRDPYPSIGYECYGRVGRGIVETCLLITLFGVCVVFLLLAAQNVASLVDRKIGVFTTEKEEARAWLLIISSILLPFTFLGTPKDMWPFALMATISTSVACLLIIVKSLWDWPTDISQVTTTDVTVESFFTSFGTIAFSFGGATLFPSFQADMKEPKKFPKAAMSAFLVVLLMYAPTCILSFVVYGSSLQSNVLQTIKNHGDTGAIKNLGTAAEVLITGHLLFSFVITLNPISQQVEEYLKWPHKFGFKRCFIRSLLLLLVLGVAEAIPKFGVILSLIGGSTVTMMAFILPCVFYLKLNQRTPFYIKVLHAEIIAVALVSGGAATYSAIISIKNTFVN
ncbi:uncharacterized protein LOC135694049 isoform X2 [Rhopilema esculentum]|eukprot:gene10552-19285_t